MVSAFGSSNRPFGATPCHRRELRPISKLSYCPELEIGSRRTPCWVKLMLDYERLDLVRCKHVCSQQIPERLIEIAVRVRHHRTQVWLLSTGLGMTLERL